MYYYFHFYLALVMGKVIDIINKYSQPQLSKLSIKEYVLSYSASKTSSSTALTRTLVSYVIDKKTNQLCLVFPK